MIYFVVLRSVFSCFNIIFLWILTFNPGLRLGFLSIFLSLFPWGNSMKSRGIKFQRFSLTVSLNINRIYKYLQV